MTFRIIKSFGHDNWISFTAFWASDFCSYAGPKETPPVVIALASLDNTGKWEEAKARGRWHGLLTAPSRTCSECRPAWPSWWYLARIRVLS